MTAWKGFDSLDLSSVEEAKPSRLPNGNHKVKCIEAIIKDTATGGKMLSCQYESLEGNGNINCNFNMANKNPQAVEIGMRQLKTFLTAGGHTNPDKPGDISTLVGLQCVVVVGDGKPWKGEDGVMRTSSEVKNFKKAGSAWTTESTDTNADEKKDDIDDEIPF